MGLESWTYTARLQPQKPNAIPVSGWERLVIYTSEMGLGMSANSTHPSPYSFLKKGTSVEYVLNELSVEITNECLMRCRHCSSGSSPQALPNELSTEKILSLIHEAKDMGAKVFSLSGGDPMLQPDNVIRYVKEACDLGFEDVLIYTTGIIQVQPAATSKRHYLHGIPYEFYDALPFSEQIKFIFSVESHDPTVHDYIMGQTLSHNRIIGNIMLTIHKGFRVWVHMVPMLPNWRDAPKLRSLLESLRVEKMSMLRFVPQTRGRANNKQLGMDADDFKAMQVMMMKMLNTESKVELRLGCPIDFRHTIDPMVVDKVHPCHAGKDLILVRPQGDVHPCAAWKTLPDTDNVNDKPLAEIWETSKIFNALREYHESGYASVKGICGVCKFQNSCKSGCLAQRLHYISMTENREVGIKDIYQSIPDPLCPHSDDVFLRIVNKASWTKA